jgi:hypothetical protein
VILQRFLIPPLNGERCYCRVAIHTVDCGGGHLSFKASLAWQFMTTELGRPLPLNWELHMCDVNKLNERDIFCTKCRLAEGRWIGLIPNYTHGLFFSALQAEVFSSLKIWLFSFSIYRFILKTEHFQKHICETQKNWHYFFASSNSTRFLLCINMWSSINQYEERLQRKQSKWRPKRKRCNMLYSLWRQIQSYLMGLR